MTTSSIQVAVRIRPFTEPETLQLAQPEQRSFFLADQYQSTPRKPAGSLRNVVDVVDHHTLVFDPPLNRPARGAPRQRNRTCTFDAVIPTAATQEEVFYSTAEPLIEPVLNGINSTVFAYGATGCGKTFTISGTPDDPGVIVRTMERLFERIDEDKDTYKTYVKLSMVEIYNEVIRDLLTDTHPTGPPGGLKLLENEAGKVTIAGVEYHEPQSATEVMQLVLRGNERRSTQSTASNAESSRSHSILQVYIGRESRQEVVDATGDLASAHTTAVLSIIDLAGSERAAATTNMGERQREGAKINKSLLALNGVMAALSMPQRGARRHVNFRDSKLTRLLKFSLQGNCRTVVIVCISPSSAHLDETNNTLTWAARASKVQTTVSRNTGAEPVSARQYVIRIAELNEQVAELLTKCKTLEGMQAKPVDTTKGDAERRGVQALFAKAKEEGAVQMPYVVAGAEARARRDAADLVAAAYRAAPEGKPHFSQLARDQDAAVRTKATQSAIEAEQTARFALEQAVRRTQARSAYSQLSSVDEKNIQLQVDAHHREVELAAAGARDRALRETITSQANAVVKAQAAILRQLERARAIDAGIGRLLAVIGPHTPEVGDLLANVRAAAAAMAAEGVHSDLIVPAGPPAPAPLATFSQSAIAMHSPAIKRRIDLTLGASSIAATLFPAPAPAAAPAASSPAARTPLPALAAATAAPAKALRWPDMAGEGALSTVKTISAASSSASDASFSASESGASQSSPQPGLLPPRASRFSALPSPLITSTLPAPMPSAIAPLSGGNDWRANRALMGRTLPSLAEADAASPDKARAQPLAPLHRLPAAGNTSLTIGIGALGLGKPSSSAASRAARRPSIGPERLGKARPRDSSVPYAAKPRVSSVAGRAASSTESSPEDRPGPLVSLGAKAGAARVARPSAAGSTLTLPTASSARRMSEIPIARRQSLLNLASYGAGVGAGPAGGAAALAPGPAATLRGVAAGADRPTWK